ncbi:Rid family detoxifying hydrolase [Paenibacillus sp. OV219]|uniref:Rid family detoxifying hydrolase n=1 Tax=Paenibacillus sp. OV219 TaxID=1884377 RepID=UPI0008B29A9C|nr:Rid family detoxifying hydrolase [Paenibacillus sp. OV219]SEO05218.1 2-iminobutanoate/2-iminopropanoate deaminase [Paenibacillus sp. OV219]
MTFYSKRPVQTKEAPGNTGPYSQGLVVGPFVYVSGQGPLDPQTKAVVSGTIEEETMVTFKNIEAILLAAGSSLNDVVKVNVYLQDIGDFERFSRTYATIFERVKVLPVRTTVGAGLTGIKVECDVVALQSRQE